jgi:hypothetical protein
MNYSPRKGAESAEYLNFNVVLLKDGIQRIVNNFPE